MLDSDWSVIGHYFCIMTAELNNGPMPNQDSEHLSALCECYAVSNMTAM